MGSFFDLLTTGKYLTLMQSVFIDIIISDEKDFFIMEFVDCYGTGIFRRDRLE